MAIALLYHADNTRDSFFFGRGDLYTAKDALKAFWSGEYSHVATMDVPEGVSGLNTVYANSQNIDDAWCEPARRSTSIGDIVELSDDTMYIVAPVGFVKLEA